MKAMILAAFAALSLGVGAASAQIQTHAAPQQQQSSQYDFQGYGG